LSTPYLNGGGALRRCEHDADIRIHAILIQFAQIYHWHCWKDHSQRKSWAKPYVESAEVLLAVRQQPYLSLSITPAAEEALNKTEHKHNIAVSIKIWTVSIYLERHNTVGFRRVYILRPAPQRHLACSEYRTLSSNYKRRRQNIAVRNVHSLDERGVELQ
jgi:hypothetical protein